MIIFPIFQALCMIGFTGFFALCWVMGLIGILKAQKKVPLRSFNGYSGQGLEDTNKRFQALRDLEKLPGGQNLDWYLKRLTLCGVLGVFSFGVKELIVATTSLERIAL